VFGQGRIPEWQTWNIGLRKRTAEYAIRVIAKNLTCGTVTVRAQSKARTLAEVEQGITQSLRQDRYEFQLVEFLETVQRTESVDA